MNLTFMAFATDMAKSVTFYEALGLNRAQPETIDEYWNAFEFDGGASFALHLASKEEMPAASEHAQLLLNVKGTGELDGLYEKAKAIASPTDISDQGFGRFFVLHDPDGLTIQITEEG